MTVQELLSDEVVRLPKVQPGEGQFNEFLKSLLDDFMRKAYAAKLPEEILPQALLKNLEIIVNGLASTITSYYRGSPFDAYRRLRDTINKSGIESYWDAHESLSSRNLYRLRIADTNYPLARKELFHIPFHLRGNISTQRYSIPGFPSLYLSNTVYVAWEEMMRPSLNSVQAARFVNKQPLKLIDLTTSRYMGNYMSNDYEQIKTDLLMWPIIAACSVKVKNRSHSFKPEYIIPQLLLQWIRNNKLESNQKHGIKFSSTHIDLNATKSIGDFFNVVIPVVDNKEKGYCAKLSGLFEMTEVLSWQLYELSMSAPGMTFIYTRQELENESDIKRLEIIKDRSMPYGFSPLSKMELTLRGMKAHDISFNQ